MTRPYNRLLSPMPPPGQINLKIEYEQYLDFRWQMYFDRFSVEQVPNGKIISFSYASQGTTPEIVPVFVSDQGLHQLLGSATEYLPGFTGVADPGPAIEELPNPSKRFSPLFSNHIRLARSGDTAEIAFYAILLNFIDRKSVV